VAKLRVQTIDKLDGARTKTDDQMMPVLQSTMTASWAGVDFSRFLGQRSNFKMGHNSLRGEEVAALLHWRGCAGVFAFFLR